MARPHPALLELAADRPLPRVAHAEVDVLLRSAYEHRMAGLLWTRVQQGEITLPRRQMVELARDDLRIQGNQLRLWRTAVAYTQVFRGIGFGVAVAKGVAAEQRWYDRMGERPSNDVDLLLQPGAERRLSEILDALRPAHVLHGPAAALLASDVLQSIDVEANGVEVDLHTDIFKIEIPTRQRHVLWDRRRPVRGPHGYCVDALDPELSLVHFLLHVNKDRFALLLGYADVARILLREDLDWAFIEDFVQREGLDVVVSRALETVVSTLGLPVTALPSATGLRASLWDRLWPSSLRLQGSDSFRAAKRRQFFIPMLARGRLIEAVWWWLRRRAFPPVALVDLFYPDVRGPYLVRLVIGRLRSRMGRTVTDASPQNGDVPTGTAGC